MMTLHIDTADEKTLVVLYNDKTTIDKIQWLAGNDTGKEILMRIDKILTDNQLTLSSVKLITVNKKPGQRTSLHRAAKTVASCLSYAQKIPVKQTP